MRALALLALAACASDPTSGPVTIKVTPPQGMVTSSPSGILCGSCANPGGCGSNGVATGSACSADFDIGSSVTLGLSEQQIYFTYTCSSPQDAAVTGCTFVVHRPMTVLVSGAEAVR